MSRTGSGRRQIERWSGGEEDEGESLRWIGGSFGQLDDCCVRGGG